MAKTKGGLDRWFKEEWVDIKTGKPCGRKSARKSKRGYPACRPSKRVSEDTPKTTKEMSSEEKKKFKRTKKSSKRIPYQHENPGRKRSNTAKTKSSRRPDRAARLHAPAVRSDLPTRKTAHPRAQRRWPLCTGSSPTTRARNGGSL